MSKDNTSADGGPLSTAGGTSKSASAVTDAVGRKLKSSYSELLREPIPDKFLELLQQLDEGGPANVGSDAGKTSAGATEKATGGGATPKRSIAKDEN